MYTLDDFSLFQLRLGHSTNAVRSEVCVASLNAAEAAEIFIARLLPLGYQIGICYAFFQAVFVEFLWYNFAAVIHVVDIPGFLMVDLENGPEGFVNSFAFMWFGFSWKINTIKIISRKYFDAHLLSSFAPCSRVSLLSSPILLVVACGFVVL